MAEQLLHASGAASYCYKLLLRHPLTAGCIDTDLPAVRRTLGRSDRFHIESAHAHHAIRVMSTETRCERFWVIDYRIFDPDADGKTKLDHVREMLSSVAHRGVPFE